MGIEEACVEIDGWHVWNKFRLLCDQNPRLQVALELTADLPSADRDLDRWHAEPVRAVVVPVDVFILNNKGFPVLSKRHKTFLQACFRHRVQIILHAGDISDALQPSGESETSKYVHYLARLFQSQDALTPQEQFELPYHDVLQAPLQPLQDNLESQTYETFERDPVKYVQYEEAILRCMQHKSAAGKKQLVVFVVGAGRGPLVVTARSAAKRAGVETTVWAIEKNPSAVFTLRHRAKLDGWDNVNVVGEDMRSWAAPYPADIIVSDFLRLMGSVFPSATLLF